MKPLFKPIPSDSSLFKVEFQNSSKAFNYAWHYHPELEITYILSSNGIRYVGNNIENFRRDDLVLLGSNLPHTWISDSETAEPATAIVIYLKESFPNQTWMESVELSAIKRLFKLMNKGICVNNEMALSLKPKFLAMAEYADFERLIVLLQMLNELANSSAYRLLCKQEFTGALNYTDKERINTVYDYIKTNYLKPISLSDIASKVNMSEEGFSRYFSKTMKKTFFEFLNEYKINIACKLLIETDKQISEICYASGYEAVSFFYSQFKKFKQCRPKEFRSKFQTSITI